MTRAVLVNGVPATGKSSIARALGARLAVPVLSLDAIKEALYDELGDADGDREFGRALGRASMQAIWSIVADLPPGSAVVIETWFRMPPHDHILRGIERAGIDRWAEVWCHASADVLVERYTSRTRHPGHPPASYAAELAQLAGIARPIAVGEVLSVDTSDLAALDIDAIARWVRDQLDLPPAPG
jgi:predicted kinase